MRFRPKQRHEQGATQNALDGDRNTASSSDALTLANSVAPSTSIQRLFPQGQTHGLRVVHNPDNAIVDIVFIHGLNGSPDKTFFHQSSGIYWPVDLLSKEIPNVRILTFGYDSRVASFFGPVGQNALYGHASDLVGSLAGSKPTTSSVPRKIIFVAHSLGGLVAKRALAVSRASAHEHLNHVEREVIGIVFMGTPHRGADMAPAANILGISLKLIRIRTNTNIVGVLRRNSEVLASVESDFSNWVKQNESFQITCFSEQFELPGVGMVVKPESATIGGWPTYSINANHMDMAKFPSLNDDGYRKVRGELERWISQLIPPEETSNNSQKDLEALLSAHLEKIAPVSKAILDASSRAPKFVNETIDRMLGILFSIEWVTQSPEFQLWRAGRQSSLWLYGDPGVGKTILMSHVLRDLRSRVGYANNWDVAAIFCSSDQTVDFVLVSLILQLIEYKPRIQPTQTVIESWEPSSARSNVSKHLWNLLEAVVTGVSGRETIFLLDGIDSLKESIMLSFFEDFLALKKQSAISGTTIRVIVSSRPFPDIPAALADYISVDPHKERGECLGTLYFQEWNAREARIDTFNQGGGWLSSHREYLNWKESQVSGLLWIEGKPGSGKSTLSKRIAQQLQEEHNPYRKKPSEMDLNNWQTIVAAFYYSFRGGFNEMSHELMLRSIAYQIWTQNASLFPLLQEFYRRLKPNSSAHPPTRRLWQYIDLKLILQSLHRVDFPLRVFIVVDGMDESDNNRRDDLLAFLKDLTIQKGKCVMKVVVASRPDNWIKSHLQTAYHIILQKENAEDIRKVVMNWKPSLGNSHLLPDFSGTRKYIIENSEGVFLWVSLVIRRLDTLILIGGYTLHSLNQAIRKLPKELGGPGGFYQDIVQNLIRRQDEVEELDGGEKEERQRSARKVLNWVTFPKRPISMKELEDVWATPVRIEDTDLLGYDLERHRPHELDRGLISYCGALVEVRDTNSGRIVQLIHQTAREFLLDPKRPASPYDLIEVDGDRAISSTCCSNIRITFSATNFRMAAEDIVSQLDVITKDLERNNLLQYSLLYFTKHLETLGDDGSGVRKIFESFIREVMSKPTCYSALLLSQWIISYWPSQQVRDIDQAKAKKCLQSALIYAAANGRGQALETLLILKADVNSYSEGDLGALHVAAYQGYGDTVKILLRHEADIDAKNGEYGTPLHIASYKGHGDIVEILFTHGVDVNGQPDGNHGTPLHIASYKGYKAITQRLLEMGAYIDSQSEQYGTPLHIASYQGHETIVEMLLHHGADPNAIGSLHLQAIRQRGHQAIVDLLLRSGAGTNTLSIEPIALVRDTPYRWYEAISKILMCYGADVSALGR